MLNTEAISQPLVPYLRQDKTFLELLTMAKENYAHPPLTLDGPGVTIAVLPINTEDCDSSGYNPCCECGYNDSLVYYIDGKTEEVICSSCRNIEFTPIDEKWRKKQKEKDERIKARGELIFYDRRQPFFCDVCGYQPDQEDTNIFCCARPGCDCSYNKCWTCAVIGETMAALESIDQMIPMEICNIIIDYLSLQQRSWQKIKAAKLPPGHSNFTSEAKLRSKFLSKEELRDDLYREKPGKIPFEWITNKFRSHLYAVEQAARVWLEEKLKEASVVVDEKNYVIDYDLIDWSSGAKLKLYYRESFPPHGDTMRRAIASRLHEHAEHFQRQLERGMSDEEIMLGDIMFTDYYLPTAEEEGKFYSKERELLKEFQRAFEELKTDHQHLLPSFITQEMISRLIFFPRRT